MRGFVLIAGLLFLTLGFAPRAEAAGLALPEAYCDALHYAKDELPLVYIQSNCRDVLQNTMFGAAAAIHNGNPSRTQAALGMLQVENSCGGAQPGTIGCDGTYRARAPCQGCTAYGAAQIINGTWRDLTSGAHRAALIRELGGCSGTTPGSLLDPNRTRNGVVRGQFIAFRNALCTNPNGVTSNQQYWGGMAAVSILVADQLDGQSTGILNRNPAAVTQLNSMGINANEVGMYTTHNLGAGGAASFMRQLGANPNASVANTLSRQILLNNWGLYCTDRTCSQPLSYAQAAQRMSASMRRGDCVTRGMTALGMPITGTVPPSPGGVYADPGVNTQAGLDAERALREAQAAFGTGGLAGDVAEDSCIPVSGASVQDTLCMQYTIQRGLRAKIPEAPKPGNTSGASTYSPPAATAPEVNQ